MILSYCPRSEGIILSLWVFLMIFHISFLLLIIGHLELIDDFSVFQIFEHEIFIGKGFVGLILSVSLLYFFFRRLVTPNKELSVPEDYFLLMLLFLTVLFGSEMDWARTWYDYGEMSVEDYREYLSSLLYLRPALPESVLLVRAFIHACASRLFREPVFNVLPFQQDYALLFLAAHEQTEEGLAMDQAMRNDLLKLFRGKLNQAMTFYLETCSRCGVCTEACHVYASMPKVKYIAAYRAEIVRRIYKKYFKGQGKVCSTLGESKELTEMALEELYEAAYSCTGCRRCMVFCPFGIDTQMIMSIAKLLLVGAHAEPEILTLLADTSITKGESLDIFKEGFLQGIKNLESEVVKKWKIEAGEKAIPVDVEGADLLYVALAGAHSIIPAAAVFNAAGENWTLSFFEAVNFGAFVGDPTKTKLILDRIMNEAKRLKVKEVCICECGTAFRVMKQLSGKQPFKVSSITQVHARYLKEGRIRVSKSETGKPLPIMIPVRWHETAASSMNPDMS